MATWKLAGQSLMPSLLVIPLWRFALVYLLLIVTGTIMWIAQTGQTARLLVASVRMTVQLVLAGLILQYLFDNDHPGLTALYVFAMLVFANLRAVRPYSKLGRRFQIAVASALTLSSICLIVFFQLVIINVELLHPQYLIPLAGMIIGNAMTGVNLGLKAFSDGLEDARHRHRVLLNLGAHPARILRPLANQALATSLVPTLNSMVGMGIIFLPGMMTGQILAGAAPQQAIIYQIAIMVVIATAVALTVFMGLRLGAMTLYNKALQFTY